MNDKLEPGHKDRLGRNLTVGDCVAVAHRNELMVAVIKRCAPKMIVVSELGTKYRSEYRKYPSECVLLDGPEVSMYLLKHSTVS
jgi:hypothetical protein